MKLKAHLTAAAVAVGTFASTAQATTIDFTSTGTDTAIGANYTVTASASGILNSSASVTQTDEGLGVNGNPDTNPNQIDGSPVFSAESLTVTFAYAVKVLSVTLGAWDFNDDFTVSAVLANGSTTAPFQVGPGLTSGIFSMPGGVDLISFTITASGALLFDGGGLLNLSRNDDFTLAKIETASVPLPAGGPLLLGALGGIAALRRRKAA